MTAPADAPKAVTITVEHLARAMAIRVEKAIHVERARIAAYLETLGLDDVANTVLIGAYVDAPVSRDDAVVVTDDQISESGDGLPPVRHMDDFEEGRALVQGARHRAGITGYEGRTGHLRDGG